jgi:hypothetical protein
MGFHIEWPLPRMAALSSGLGQVIQPDFIFCNFVELVKHNYQSFILLLTSVACNHKLKQLH